MKRAAVALILVLGLSLMGQALKRLCEVSGIPFLTVTLLRDALWFGLFIWALGNISLSDARRLGKPLFLFIAWTAFYLLVSAFEDRHIAGLYYVRLYLLPVMFFVTAQCALGGLDRAGLAAMLRGVMWLNALVLLAAFVTYGLVHFLPATRRSIFGTEFLPYAWYIAGAGKAFMRMGLPFSGPNSLGYYFVMMELLYLCVLLFKRDKGGAPGCVALALVNLAGLAATFSRSSMLALLVGALVLVAAMPAIWRARTFFRASFFAVVLLVLFGGSLLALELLSDGFVSRWIALNVSLQDPSLRGHMQSLTDAYDNFERYYLYGYPRGTVGPKAFMFYVSNRFNVENSVLGMVLDAGLFGAAAFFVAYALLLAAGYRSRLQLPVIVGCLIGMQFLPYIFEPDIISLALFIYVLVGELVRSGYLTDGRNEDGERLGLPKSFGTASQFRPPLVRPAT